jgi:pyrimidine-nucleoside phosphorylase
MRAVDLIVKKRDGHEMTREEIFFFVHGFSEGIIPDYQASAWAMAVTMRGMTERETTDLTEAMIDSGDRLDLSGVVPFAVDKHSTGGVGDKTSLVVLPIVTANGVPVGKMSGKGLSFTGGTLDKMESFPGYRIDLSKDEFLKQLKEVGIVLSGQTPDLAPADGKFYALRDVTGTVPSVPLIVASVMSKKIAAGADGVVLDVKVGAGAFMQTVEEAVELAEGMASIGKRSGKKVAALVSDMNQPLGSAIGNVLEVKEAIQTLKGDGPEDLIEHSLVIAAHMLVLAGRTGDLDEAKALAAQSLQDGTGLDKFRTLVQAQSGEAQLVDDEEKFPTARFIETVLSWESGYVGKVQAREIGLGAMALGAGRENKGDPIDHSVGIIVHKKVGQLAEKGEPLFTIHANDEKLLMNSIERVKNAFQISKSEVDELPLFYRTITS